MQKSNFSAIAVKIPISSDEQIESIMIEVVADNVSIEAGTALYITDIMLQGGTVATSHIGQVAEIRWSFENA
jgi:hypothetical protein